MHNPHATTIDDLYSAPDILTLRCLEDLETATGQRIAQLDQQVQRRLDDGEPWNATTLSDIDVLCAALAEQEELCGAVRLDLRDRRAGIARRRPAAVTRRRLAH